MPNNYASGILHKIEKKTKNTKKQDIRFGVCSFVCNPL